MKDTKKVFKIFTVMEYEKEQNTCAMSIRTDGSL